MGGMQVLEWAATYPARVLGGRASPRAARHSAQNIAFHEVGRQAIMADPKWRGGDYYCERRSARGRARGGADGGAHHLSVRGRAAPRSSGGGCRSATAVGFGFDADFQVESYLRHQGISFVDRFDANAYLYITRAMDYFDLSLSHGGVLAQAFARARGVRFCVLSFTSDWLYPTTESRHVVRALNAAGARASFLEIESDRGHDAFLLDEPVMHGALQGFLDSAGHARGLS